MKKIVFLKNLLEYISVFWGKLAVIQKIAFTGIIIAVIGSLAGAAYAFTRTHTLVPVIDAPIMDEATFDRIIQRIKQEGVKTYVAENRIIQVADEAAARRMRAILIREDLIPTNTDRWTITDFERNVNFRRAQTQMITNHIKAIDDIDDANVTIVFPERELFRSDQNPVTASVIITPKPGSDITVNHKKIEGIQRLIKLAVEDLKDENIVITDQHGFILNNFE